MRCKSKKSKYALILSVSMVCKLKHTETSHFAVCALTCSSCIHSIVCATVTELLDVNNKYHAAVAAVAMPKSSGIETASISAW